MFFAFFIYWFFWERGRGTWGEREKERERKKHLFCCSTYVYIHWLLLVCALTRDGTCSLGVSGQCSNHLSFLTRVHTFFKGTFPFSVCLTQCSWAHGLCEGADITTDPPLYSQLRAQCQVLEKKWLLSEHIIFHQPIRSNTRFLCPWDFLLVPSGSCKTPQCYSWHLRKQETPAQKSSYSSPHTFPRGLQSPGTGWEEVLPSRGLQPCFSGPSLDHRKWQVRKF